MILRCLPPIPGLSVDLRGVDLRGGGLVGFHTKWVRTGPRHPPFTPVCLQSRPSQAPGLHPSRGPGQNVGSQGLPSFPLSLTHTQLIDKSYRLYFPNRFMLRRASCRLQGDTWAQASLVPHPGYSNSFLQSTSSPFVSLKSALGMVAKRSFFFFF